MADNNHHKVIIIGSGPAGIACAKALVSAGRRVTLLDSGLQLEENRKASIRQLQETDPVKWKSLGNHKRLFNFAKNFLANPFWRKEYLRRKTEEPKF